MRISRRLSKVEIKEFDRVRLKDGREGDVMEVYPDGSLVIDIGSSEDDWDAIYDKTIEDVEKKLI